MLTRYPGIVVVAAVAVSPLFRKRDPFPTRVRRFLAAGLVGVGPTALWLFRNARLGGRITDHETDGVAFAPGLLRDLPDAAARWFRFDWDSPALLPALLAGALVTVFALRRESRGRAADGGAGDRNRGDWQSPALFGGFGLAHAVGLVAAGSFIGGAFESRYLDVAYPAFVVAAALALDRLLASARDRRPPADFSGRGGPRLFGARTPTRLTAGLAAGLTLWAAGSITSQAQAIAQANAGELAGSWPGERNYNTAPWNRIESLAHLREHPEAEVVFTNLPPIHWIAIHHARGGRGTVRWLPNRLHDFRSRAPEGALVLWLAEWSSEHFYDYGRAALRLLPGLEPAAEFSDGAVFRMARAAAPGPDLWRAAYESAAPPGTGANPAGFEVRWGTPGLPGFEGAALLYLREPCDEEQLRARFFLHLYPEAPGHLTAARREHRFDNRDFRFEEHGVILDRTSPSPKCVAIVPLPGYPVRRVRTGQWTAAAGELWAAEPAPPSPR